MTIKKKINDAYKAEPIVILTGGGILGNGALHEGLHALGVHGSHNALHVAIGGCLVVAARQSVFAPKTVKEREAGKKKVV